MTSRQGRKAYLIYECRSGWCICPAEVPYFPSDKVQDQTWAFSRLSQALWWLSRRHPVRKSSLPVQDPQNGHEPSLRKEAPSSGERKAAEQERSSPAQGAGEGAAREVSREHVA